MTDKSNLTLLEKDGVTIVSFSESTLLDAFHVTEVGQELYNLVEKDGARKLILDLSTIKMLSSQALSVMLKMRQLLDGKGGKMVISGIKPQLYRVFKITNLINLFEFFEDTNAALASGTLS